MGLEKLRIKFMEGVDFRGPIDGRRYTLTHSDFSGDLFLSVGLEFNRKAISGFYTRLMRDEVLAEWLKREGKCARARFFYAWRRARKKSGIYLKPKDLRDFFSQEMGKAFVPDRYIDIFQGKTPKNVLTKHYNPHGISMLKEIDEKANLKLL